MARLDGAWDPQERATESCLLKEPDTVCLQTSVEPAWRHELRSLQPAAVASFPRALEVLRNRDEQSDDEDDQRPPARRPDEIRQRLVAIDPLAQQVVQRAMSIRAVLPYEPDIPHLLPNRCERERRLNRVGHGLEFFVQGQTTAALAVDHMQQTVPTGLETEVGGEFAANVGRQEQALERR